MKSKVDRMARAIPLELTPPDRAPSHLVSIHKYITHLYSRSDLWFSHFPLSMFWLLPAAKSHNSHFLLPLSFYDFLHVPLSGSFPLTFSPLGEILLADLIQAVIGVVVFEWLASVEGCFSAKLKCHDSDLTKKEALKTQSQHWRWGHLEARTKFLLLHT